VDDSLLVGIRWGLYLTLSIAFGVPLFALHAVETGHRSVLPLRALVALSAAAALGLSLLAWVAMTAAMADKPMTGVARDDLMAVVAMPGLGGSWLVRIAALGVLMLGASIGGLRRLLPVLGVVLGAVALGSLAWTGHGAAGDGVVGHLHLAADVVHLLAVGAWIGALVTLSLLLRRAVGQPTAIEVAYRALTRFSRMGTMIVAAIVGTGLVNSYVLVGPGRVLDLPATLWGQLLLAKLALFAGMLGLAAANRWVLTPALHRTPATAAALPALLRLRRSVMFETGVAFFILVAVAWLGTLPPVATN